MSLNFIVKLLLSTCLNNTRIRACMILQVEPCMTYSCRTSKHTCYPEYLIKMEGDNGWKFAQCFGDKGDVDDVTEGTTSYLFIQLTIL